MQSFECVQHSRERRKADLEKQSETSAIWMQNHKTTSTERSETSGLIVQTQKAAH